MVDERVERKLTAILAATSEKLGRMINEIGYLVA